MIRMPARRDGPKSALLVTARNNVQRGRPCDADPALPVLVAPIKPLENRSGDFPVKMP